MTLAKSLIAWFVLFLVAFANGAFRELYYARYLGELRAHQVSCLLGIALIIGTVWVLTRPWPFRSPAHAWRTGWLWLALTVAWEFLFGHFVMRHPWDRLLKDYAFWEGRLWALVLASIVMAPLLAHRWHRREQAR
jgi:hypothetical protein